MKKLNIVSCVTNELRYSWETAVFLYNFISLGYENIKILLFIKPSESIHPSWEELITKFPSVEFAIFHDNKNIAHIGRAFNYPPIYRFWLLQEYFKLHPHLKDEAILYTDTDVILPTYLDFSPYLLDDINYISWTGNKERTDNYLWQPYFDKKIEQIAPDKLEQYKKLDVIARMGFICNTTRETITENNPNTGGAQYLLKNITSQFWTDCFNTCCEIKTYLSSINQIFMKGANTLEKENNGFQSFCSDMVALLYNLWGYGFVTSCPSEMDFAWSTDRIHRLKECGFLHNAGITAEAKCRIAFENGVVEGPLFFKGKYQYFSPFEDLEYLHTIINHPVSKDFCNAEYVKAILKTYEYLKNGRNI